MISSYALTFAEPLALALLVLLPLIGLVALGGATPAARRRRWLAVGLRSALLVAIIFALSGARLTRASERLAVVFLVDASDSVGAAGRAQAEAYVQNAIAQLPKGDRAAVILFGGDATVERAISDRRDFEPFRAQPIATATDIAGAVRLGLALFPDGAARRIVILSDGEENRGDLEAAAMMAAANEVQISTVGLTRPESAEVLVSDVVAPARARAGDVVEVRITVESTRETPAILRLSADGQLLKEETIQLRPGTNTFSVSVTVGERGFRRFDASVVTPDGVDTAYQNNSLSAFTDVAGPVAALILEHLPGEADNLAAALRAGGIQVDVLAAERAPGDLPSYAGYDVVVLVNVAAQTLGPTMTTLQTYVRDLGRGLVAIGGDNAYGVGGYFNTPLEETLPVRMDIRDPQNLPQVSVDFTIDKSGSMSRCHGEPGAGQARIEGGLPKTDLAKEATYQAISLLGPNDEVGIVAFDDEAVIIAPLAAISSQPDIASALAGIQPEGGTNIYAGLAAAVEQMKLATGRVKHIILITDGWSNTGDFEALLEEMRRYGITLSVIGAGGGAADFLEQLAADGGGRFYAVTDPHEIPEIFMKETKIALRAYIVEGDIALATGAPSPILDGITALPNLRGYVSTTPKATAQTVLLSDRAEPILAQWQYGLGRSVAWTSDAKGQWASGWIGWDGFVTFWTQTVRWAAAGTESDVDVSLDRAGAGTAITVDSLDPSGQFRNDLLTTVSVLGPDGTRTDLPLTQVAPGRYAGELGELPPGAYMLGVTQRDPLSGEIVAGGISGLVVGYSPEYGPPSGDGAANLERARDLTGGIALDPSRPADAFSHDLPAAKVQTPLWPWLTLAALLLLPFDVAIRRLAIGRRELAAFRAALRRVPGAETIPRPTHATVLLGDRRRSVRRRDHAAPPIRAPDATNPPAAPPAPVTSSDTGPPRAAPGEVTPGPGRAPTSSLLAAKRRATERRTDESQHER